MIGLFGGTFDPAHVGHERMARAALAAGLRRVIVMPCHISPHKTDYIPSPAEHRVRMLELALTGIAGAEISRYELDQGGISFTRQTLAWLREQFPDEQPALIVGADQCAAFPRWDRFPEWSRGLDIFVFRRTGQPPPTPIGEAVYHFPPEEIPAVSGAEIRQRVKAGLPLTGLVNPEVEAYIRTAGLYQ